MISYNEKERVFRLDTPGSTYLMGIVDQEGFLGHIYYGSPIPDDNMQYLMRTAESPFVPTVNNRDRVGFYYSLPTEFSGHGNGDFRQSCLVPETPEGYRNCDLYYESHTITPGKPGLPGLPATFGGEADCDTLDVVLVDRNLDLRVHLLYTAFRHVDAICRSVRVENGNKTSLQLRTALSACLDLDYKEYDTVTLIGEWSAERTIQRTPLHQGKQAVSSLRGVSSHEEHPFLALAEHTATQTQGRVYAMNFVYSGNFLAQAEMNRLGFIRMTMGIHPQDFSWSLEKGESFQTPEVVMVYSDAGLGKMTRTFHDLYRNHLISQKWAARPRPVLVNNWEATYFQFNTDKLLELGRQAADLGIEMLVMDDGWFGKRDDDNTGLGDWFVNERKLPGGLNRLVTELKAMGLKFGIWFEPEMVSRDSDLFRAHPDWALQIPGKTPNLKRNQLVLDLSRKEVRDCVYDQLYKVLSSAEIAYVKWDMNRNLTDVASACLPSGRMGELYHRYMLGVYELQGRMLRDFPELLLENCSSGGGRFDPGMLYYSPQIWTSDNTDAISRLKIQEGTALIYPLSSMGAHVAICPSHSTGRTTPFATRGHVALPGCFGYELDITKLSDEEKALIPGQIADYKAYGEVFHQGDYYRLASYRENHRYDAILSVTKDQSMAVLISVQVQPNCQDRTDRVELQGLDPRRMYRRKDTDEVRSGAGWMLGGVLLPKCEGDYTSNLMVLEAV